MGEKSSAVKCVRITVMLGLLGGAIYTTWHLLGRPDVEDIKEAIGNFTQGGGINFPDLDLPDDWDFGDFSDVLDNLTGFVDEWLNDPYVGNNSTYYWKNPEQKGLSLTMWNALDDTWQDEYAAALKDWEEGTPDALTLSTEKVDVDNKCSPHDGVMKVCNGNYGETGWLGINELLLIGDEIQSSVAKMNEWYLLNGDEFERQYTMCHEIGHGYGLAHTDENFYNKDLGNCMDYTDSPENNLHPDITNYNTLVSLYGEVPGDRRYLKNRSPADFTQRISPALQHSYETAMANFIEGSKELEDAKENMLGWRLLGNHAGGAKYGRRLPGGYTLEVNTLSVIQGSY